ncbi:hypothetical protein SAMN05216516_11038 [Izhakiella capsodis]|uniref:Uncharacterized protein n=1 Tax=Izhakiella capsodis TaxID=1367852 RepID=A0A1I4ZXL7_9GAMM|nr:hypothetical protein [Izhakiella capsodis]SFN54850.1 hypothetical protein SAMN05216516_11038 [Izhakiella capsodis]
MWHGKGDVLPREHALNTEAGPLADAVTVFFEVAIPAVIDVEEEFGGMGDMHGAEYKAELRSCKHPKLRSSAAQEAGVLRSKNNLTAQFFSYFPDDSARESLIYRLKNYHSL